MSPKQKEFFNEEYSDKQVIASLLREINKLNGENNMSKLYKIADGSLLLGHNFEHLVASNPSDVKDAQDLLDKFQEEVAILQEFIASAPVAPAVDPNATPDHLPTQPEIAATDTVSPTDDVSTEPVVPSTEAPVDNPVAPPAPAEASTVPTTEPVTLQ